MNKESLSADLLLNGALSVVSFCNGFKIEFGGRHYLFTCEEIDEDLANQRERSDLI